MPKRARSKRTQNPIRFRRVRRDGTIGSLVKTWERKLGLPQGCIKIVGPTGKKLRSDATVTALKRLWHA